MIEQLFLFLDAFETNLWGFVGVPVLMFLGFYLTFLSKFVQVRKFPQVMKTFAGFLKIREEKVGGVHPLKAFFACVGGCVGVGNIVGICTAAQIGGPGALFWIWVTAIAGMMVKYGEVYLGLKYRVPDGKGGYNGGPMYFIQRVFAGKWMPYLVCFLLCIYGVEVYQFSVVIKSITLNFPVNEYAIIILLLLLVIFAGSGGVRRVGGISSTIIPLFVVIYVGMGLWVLANNISEIPAVFASVFTHAFTPHAAVGGFVGSSVLATISQGVKRGCYTGDLGVGYASVIHAESSSPVPEKQASLVIFDIFLDTFMICTTSVLLILVTDVWHQPMEGGLLVQNALGSYFPYMDYFMPFFLFLLGYSTINAYFCVGLKCAEFMHPTIGRPIYYAYAIVALVSFSFVDTAKAQTLMTIANGLLLIINCYGIFCLRHEISYNIGSEEEREPLPEAG